MITDPHRTNTMGISWTEGAITVAKQVTRRFIPGEGVDNLTRDPLGGGLSVTRMLTSRRRAWRSITRP
jgi:hypothetical protein